MVYPMLIAELGEVRVFKLFYMITHPDNLFELTVLFTHQL